MLTGLRLKNFKGWADTKELQLAPITVFFGTNSSGKTSLLQSLLLLKQTAASTDRSRVLYPGDEQTLVDLGTTADLVHGHSLGKSIRFSLNWRPEETPIAKQLKKVKELGFSVDVKASQRGEPHVVEAVYSFNESRVVIERSGSGKYRLYSEPWALVRRRPGRPWPLPAPIRFYGFPDEVTAYYQSADWLADLALALERQLARIHYVGPLREYPKRSYLWAGEPPPNVGKRGELATAALLAAKAERRQIIRGKTVNRRYTPFQEQIAAWLKELGMITSFRVVPIGRNRKEYEVRVRRAPRSTEVLITDVGFGVSQVLPVLVQSYYALAGETVIFEQPEIHLHPRVQADLADVLIDAVRTCQVQFLVESHSEHFLRRLQRRIAEAERITHEEVSLYACDVEEGTSVISKLDVDALGNIRNWPKDFFGDEMADRAAMLEASVKRRSAGER